MISKIAISDEFDNNVLQGETMQKLVWVAFAGLCVLVSCSPDTLGTLVPPNALAVAYVESPANVLVDGASLAKDLGQKNPSLPEGFPWDALDLTRPWAASVLPVGSEEGSELSAFQVYLALVNPAKNFSRIRDFFATQGDFTATLVENYFILSTKGAPAAQLYPAGKSFDLNRAKLSEPGGVAVYIAISSVNPSVLSEVPKEALDYFPALQKELEGVRLGFYLTSLGQVPGARLTMQTDFKKGSQDLSSLKALAGGSKLEEWSSLLDERALIGLGATLPPPSQDEEAIWAQLPDPLLSRQLKNLRSLLGPRLVFNLTGGMEASAKEPQFSGVLEAKDPQAVRQAIKSLIASGALQKNFLQFAMDADTPLVYQDQPGGPLGLRSRLTLGPFRVNFAWAADRVIFASGTDLKELDSLATNPKAAHPWQGAVPPGANLLVSASPGAWGEALKSDAFGKPDASLTPIFGSFKIESDGNPRFQLWWGAQGLKSVWDSVVKFLPELLKDAEGLNRPELPSTQS